MKIRLDELETGRIGVVAALSGPTSFLSRVGAFGVTPGTEIHMIRNDRKGPLIAYSRDTFIVLGRSEAARVHLFVAVDGHGMKPG